MITIYEQISKEKKVKTERTGIQLLEQVYVEGVSNSNLQISSYFRENL